MTGEGLPTAGGALATRWGALGSRTSWVVIDAFDTGLHSGWTDETDDYTQETNTVYEGSGAARLDTSTNFISIESYPGDGLPAYFQNGEEMRLYTYRDEPSVFELRFGASADGNDFWRLRNDPPNGETTLWQTTSGTGSELANVGTVPPESAWIETRLKRFDDASHDTGEVRVTQTRLDTDDVFVDVTATEPNLTDHSGLRVIWENHGGTSDLSSIDGFAKRSL